MGKAISRFVRKYPATAAAIVMYVTAAATILMDVYVWRPH